MGVRWGWRSGGEVGVMGKDGKLRRLECLDIPGIQSGLLKQSNRLTAVEFHF